MSVLKSEYLGDAVVVEVQEGGALSRSALRLGLTTTGDHCGIYNTIVLKPETFRNLEKFFRELNPELKRKMGF